MKDLWFPNIPRPTTAMTDRIQYFKRYRMEFDLIQTPLPSVVLPEGYHWAEWNEADIERHALVKHRSFRDEIDSEVFSSLGEYNGCLRLMNEISQRDEFLGPATWLIVYLDDKGFPQDCGTIQGLNLTGSLGSIQNVGVVPEHRGLGLGRALVAKCLEGFALAKNSRVVLEVTASNLHAVKLYRGLGFRITKTMYRSAPIEETLRLTTIV